MSRTRYPSQLPQTIAALSLFTAALLQLPEANALASHFSIGTAARGTHSIYTKELKQAAALQSFNFRFQNQDDHELKSVGMLQAPGKASFSFADQDGNDAYRFDASFQRLSDGDLHQAARNDCRGSCTLPIPAENDKVFVLAGFEVKNRRGEDRNVRQISVIPELPAGRVRVIFSDNSGFDYTTRVQYLLLPKSAVRAEEIYTNTEKRRTQKPRTRGVRVLQGFSLRFTNGDHHVSALGVSAGATIAIAMNDKNYDDPFRGEARFAVLR